MLTLSTVTVMVGMVASVVASGSGNVPECKFHSDGCSIPLGLPFFYKSIFTPACHRHDVCYGCGAGYGLSREDCDTTFLQDMINACHAAKRRRFIWNIRSLCISVATNLYYKVVDWFAHHHYRSSNDLRMHCHEDWVPTCLPPRNH